MANRTPPKQPVIIIPARMASTRLPGKPLADICGTPMIVHVLRRAEACKSGPVVVACDGPEIASVVEQAGGTAVVTKPGHATGSDRIWEALNSLKDNAAYDAVINVQGDEPLLDPEAVRAAYGLLRDTSVDIGTLMGEIKEEGKKNAPQTVKAALDMAPGARHGRALYFSRMPVPSGEGPMYHHIGLYAYRRDALARFVAAKPSPLEKRESLEQLRALGLGLRIEAALTEREFYPVDTKEDLERVRKLVGKA